MTTNYDWHDEAFMEKAAAWGHDCDAVEKAETWFKVSYVNDAYAYMIMPPLTKDQQGQNSFRD